MVVAWLILFARAAWRYLEWYLKRFLATDKRLILVHGVLNRQVDMMPVTKVTDMRYVRSPAGHVFGYGKFVPRVRRPGSGTQHR